MDFMTSTILSGIAFDIIKNGTLFTTDILKEKLRNWLIDDVTLQQLSEALNSLEINDEMSPKAIERRIDRHVNLNSLLSQVKGNNTNTQIHNGIGDNVMTNNYK